MSRAFHAYCIGSGKTGTASVAAMFADHYRSAHEPMPAWTNQLAIEFDRGNLHPATAALCLDARDRDLNLELDSSHPLGFMAAIFGPWLGYGDMKFIVTVRDPVTWIRSRLRYHYAVDPPAWRQFRNHFWWGWLKYCEQDQYLRSLNLCSVESYYKAYEKQYRLIKVHLPPNRVLVIRTEELNESIDRLALFLGISPKTIKPAHTNKAPPGFDPSAKLDSGWLWEQSRALCPTAWAMWEGGGWQTETLEPIQVAKGTQ